MGLLGVGTLAVLIFIHIYGYLLLGVFLWENSFRSVKCFIGVITRLIDQILNISPAIIWKPNVCSSINTNSFDSYESSETWLKCYLKVVFCVFVLTSWIEKEASQMARWPEGYKDPAVIKKASKFDPGNRQGVLKVLCGCQSNTDLCKFL